VKSANFLGIRYNYIGVCISVKSTLNWTGDCVYVIYTAILRVCYFTPSFWSSCSDIESTFIADSRICLAVTKLLLYFGTGWRRARSLPVVFPHRPDELQFICHKYSGAMEQRCKELYVFCCALFVCNEPLICTVYVGCRCLLLKLRTMRTVFSVTEPANTSSRWASVRTSKTRLSMLLQGRRSIS